MEIPCPHCERINRIYADYRSRHTFDFCPGCGYSYTLEKWFLWKAILDIEEAKVTNWLFVQIMVKEEDKRNIK